MSTYDVTGVTESREYIEIAKDLTSASHANSIARERSADKSVIAWSAVFVTSPGRVAHVATYVDGKLQ